MDQLMGFLTPPEDEMELEALSDQLRGRKRAADFFAATTIPQISGLAQTEQQAVQREAQRSGILKNALAQREWQTEQSRLNRENQLAIAKMYSGRKDGGGYGTGRERQVLDDAAEFSNTINFLSDTFNTGYGTPAGIPFAGTAGNWIARTVQGTAAEDLIPLDLSNREEAALWHSMAEEVMKTPYRHKFFGAALTRTEKPLFNMATWTENQSGEYIQSRLAAMKHVMFMAAADEAYKALQSGAYSPDDILVRFAHIPEIRNVIAMATGPNPGESYMQWREERDKQAAQMIEQLQGEKAEDRVPQAEDEATDQMRVIRID